MPLRSLPTPARSAYPRTSRAFLDADVYAAERRAFFERGWVYAGRLADLAPGSWAAVPMWGTSVLLARTRSGELRAFQNRCAHRAARLVEPGGCRKGALSCPYHAWTYDHEGALRALPEPDGLPVDRATLGLIPLPVDVVGELIYVAGSPQAPPLRASLGEGAELIESWGPLGDPVATLEIEIDANWKVVVCGVIEDYHLPYVHGRTLDPYVQGKARPHQSPGGHSGYTIDLFVPAWMGGILRVVGGIPDAYMRDYRHVLIAPNLTLGRSMGMSWINRHDPDGPGRTVQRFTLYDRTDRRVDVRPGSWVRQIRRSITHKRHHEAFLEDRDIFHEVHAGHLAAVDAPWGPVHGREPRVGHFLDAVAQHVELAGGDGG